MNITLTKILGAALIWALWGTASAGLVSASGALGSLTWEARSTIVGVTPTAGTTGGDPLYFPAFPKHGGVVGLTMNYGAGNFVCSGSLLNDRRSILTAAHCVSDGFGTPGPLTTTAFFQPVSGLTPPNDIIYTSTDAVQIAVSSIAVHPGYTGEVIDQNDIAVLRLANLAPAWASSYGLFTGSLEDAAFEVAGYGRRSTVGGSKGLDAAVGRLRVGENRYDYRWGDAGFGGFFTALDANGENFFGKASIDYSWIADFDSGLATNDASCLIAQAVNPVLAGNPSYCDLGRGAREVGIAGGDSGGPGFINGMLASVNSYGLTFGTGFGDVNTGLNSSFGELSGFVPVGLHSSFIMANMLAPPGTIPVPNTLFLMLVALPLVRRRRNPE